MDEAAYGSIDEVCEDFVRKSNATCALLVGQDGMLLHRSGAVADLDVDSLAALAAGSFASGREMAGLIGESTFDVAMQQGQQNHLQLIRVGDEAILVVVFDDQTTAAMVRLHGQRAAQRLAGVLAGGAAEGAEAEGDGGPDGFVQQTQQRTEQLRSSFRLRTVSMVLALLAAIVAVVGALLRQ
jgi:predicted regulator of Ras-like GTPase activity (Roadblock/LC7/MglB family)